MTTIALAKPSLDGSELAAVQAVLASGHLTQGAVTECFERQLASYLGLTEAVACTSATTALHLAMVALNIGAGDEVVVPSFTFPATAHAVIQQGATPVFADIDLDTFNLNADSLQRCLNDRTRAVIPVHLFGMPANMAAIQAIADHAGIAVVEDAACALGAVSQGRPCGALGDLACFSFHPRKIITTGEGGMVTGRDTDLLHRIRRLRQHGGDRVNGRFDFKEPGFNYRMSDVNAALGTAQLNRLDTLIAQRRTLARHYDQLLGRHCPQVRLPCAAEGDVHSYQAYVVLLPRQTDRDALIVRLRARGVETTLGTYALHAERYMQARYAYRNEQLPDAYTAYRHTLTLPLYPDMSTDTVAHVVSELARAL